MNSSAQARRQASFISSSVALASPQRRFSAIVPEKSTFFCSTIATALRKVSMSYSRTSTPPTLTVPSVVSYSLDMSCTSVDLEEPVPPIMPIVSPERMCRSMSERAFLSAVAEYLKLTPSKSMLPSFTSVTGFAGFSIVLSSLSTSTIRLPDSPAIAIIVNAIESIIRLLSIIKP